MKTRLLYAIILQLKWNKSFSSNIQTFLFSQQFSFLRLPVAAYYFFVKVAPLESMLLDLLEIFLAFAWGMILWTWHECELPTIPHFHYIPSSSHNKRYCCVLLMLVALHLHQSNVLYCSSSCPPTSDLLILPWGFSLPLLKRNRGSTPLEKIILFLPPNP